MTITTALTIVTMLASNPDCTPVPHYQSGRMVATACLSALPSAVTVIDLSDHWTPRLFSETMALPQSYRPVFLGLATERLETGKHWDPARQDRYYELFGVFPSFSVIAGRLADEARHHCHDVVSTAEAHLNCEGLARTSLATYQRRHMIPAAGRFDAETRMTLMQDSHELDFRTLLRALRERVADATGLIEDGSAANAWEPVLGRYLDAREYRTVLRPDALPGAAPDLVARATEAAAVALGWTTPAAAALSLKRGVPGLVALRLPPAPPYHWPQVQLRAEIDRGDVWREPPLDTSGQRRRSPIRRRPTLVLYAVTASGEVPLVRWPTTIGGWQPEKRPDGSVTLEYKQSPVGRRYWRDLLAAPAWFPPPSTPDAELVRRGADGRWTTDDQAVGPGYHSAYGLMALLHHRATEGKAGAPSTFTDVQIRTHGSGNYRSILRGSSHGCHRLFNHLAIRLGSFLLYHHSHIRHGSIVDAYVRRIQWKGQTLVLRAETRGYRYELVPPIPVDVLPGHIVRSRQPRTVPPPPTTGTPLATRIRHGH